MEILENSIGVAEMFEYMGTTRDGEAIFLDFQKSDFNFLVKIVEGDNKNKTLAISYWYRDTKWNLETVETTVPQKKHEEAKNFFHEVNAYATVNNPAFMLEIQKYDREFVTSSAPTGTENQSNKNVRTFHP